MEDKINYDAEPLNLHNLHYHEPEAQTNYEDAFSNLKDVEEDDYDYQSEVYQFCGHILRNQKSSRREIKEAIYNMQELIDNGTYIHNIERLKKEFISKAENDSIDENDFIDLDISINKQRIRLMKVNQEEEIKKWVESDGWYVRPDAEFHNLPMKPEENPIKPRLPLQFPSKEDSEQHEIRCQRLQREQEAKKPKIHIPTIEELGLGERFRRGEDIYAALIYRRKKAMANGGIYPTKTYPQVIEPNRERWEQGETEEAIEKVLKNVEKRNQDYESKIFEKIRARINQAPQWIQEACKGQQQIRYMRLISEKKTYSQVIEANHERWEQGVTEEEIENAFKNVGNRNKEYESKIFESVRVRTNKAPEWIQEKAQGQEKVRFKKLIIQPLAMSSNIMEK